MLILDDIGEYELKTQSRLFAKLRNELRTST